MAPVLLVLALLVLAAGLRGLLRARRTKAHPVFAAHGILAERLTEGLLHALISDRGYLRADTRIVGSIGPALVVDRLGAGGRILLFPTMGLDHEGDLKGLRLLAGRQARDRSGTLVVVGGDESFGERVFEATAPQRTIHIAADGSLKEARRGWRSTAPRLVVERALDQLAGELREGGFPTVDFETARRLADPATETLRSETSRFRGVVTPALTAAIVLCFLAEVAITRDAFRGEGSTLAVAYRMGAIHAPSILGGEWERLIAAPFIHFGLLHLLMNGWAQWSLGGPIEYLLGPWGFLALWTVSALGASLTSLAFNEGNVAAGASGAIFGLLGAFTTFVFFRKDVLPQPVPRALRNGVLATLLLNLLISFIPSIDMAAHAGGFLTGALMALGLKPGRGPRRMRPGEATSLRLAVAALVLLGVGISSLRQRADLAIRVPEIEGVHRIAELELPIPKGFSVSESRAKGLTTVDAEGIPFSPYSITYKVSEPQRDTAAALRLLKTLRAEEGSQGPSEWIALSRLGLQNLRAIEIVVVAPSSRRDEAEILGKELADRIR